MSAHDVALRIQRALARPPRHLVVSVLLEPAGAVVTSVALSAGRPPELLQPGHPWLAAVTRDEEVVHLCRVPDPFAAHGGGAPDRPGRNGSGGRRVGRVGRVVVAVPFTSLEDLTHSRVHAFDLGSGRSRSTRQGLLDELTGRLRSGTGVRSVDFAAITGSGQWAAVGRLLGPTDRPSR